MTKSALYISLIIGFLSLARGFSDVGSDLMAHWILYYGLLWLVATWYHRKWFPSFALLTSVFLAILGVINGASIHWMMAGGAGALLHWDISNFQVEMTILPKNEDVQGLERRHLFRLTVVTLVALLFVTILELWHGSISVLWYILLGFIFILGIVQLIVWLIVKR